MEKSDIIIVKIWEGLGNQLFQYAYARALKEKGFDVRLDISNSYKDIFKENPKHDVRQSSIQNFNITIPTIDVEEYGKYQYIMRNTIKNRIIYSMARYGLWKYKFYDESMNLMRRVDSYPMRITGMKGGCYIKGWFQDERNFKQIRKILLNELTPKKKIRISHELQQALSYEESVSLHVRRGDYIKIGKTLNAGYYNKAINYMKKRYKKPLFLLFSEDLDWIRHNLEIGDYCIYINEDRKLLDFEELLIMSCCRSNIISNSTFSWWGAWLNRNPDKTVVAPSRQWFPVQKNIIPTDWFAI